ncbi:MAG TPA: Hsp20/alpha crystallin family protein [Chloroflexota bacterium]|nr:Hsp20/alpha crystallin family protein [Chloroflexota bacterium]
MQDALRPPALPAPRLTADIYETPDGDAYVVEIPVPGLSAGEITIEVTPEMVTVTTRPAASQDDAQRRYLQHEQQVQPMSRVFEFPVEINPDEISANLDAGMLKLHVPKAAASRRKVIKLQKQGD